MEMKYEEIIRDNSDEFLELIWRLEFPSERERYKLLSVSRTAVELMRMLYENHIEKFYGILIHYFFKVRDIELTLDSVLDGIDDGLDFR